MFMKFINLIFVTAFLGAVFTVLSIHSPIALLLLLGFFGALMGAIWLPRTKRIMLHRLEPKERGTNSL